ncbi:uncharacterized protein A4U43_C07F370 [Asparagus officinalis]|uniref:ELM2 domain-containing protein n=1 Tax=Asparagus officinalis TaxID=4686 RepID=A0A5P1EBJ2_ASPOF|nr:uncharacterized protein A4U43_C07F370 [Asparagus officinalis]
MTSLSSDLTVDLQPKNSCVGCAMAEAEIQALLDNISVSFSKNPAKFLGFEIPESEPLDCSGLLRCWIEKFGADSKSPLCPDLKKRIEALVSRLVLSERGNTSRGRKRKLDEDLVEMLSLLRGVAANPSDRAEEDRQWKDKILNARKALFLKATDVANIKEFPYLQKQRNRKFFSATNNGPDSCSIMNNGVRRSQRTLLKFGNGELPRKRIPIGPDFQAEVPDWINSPNKEDSSDENDELDNSRWLGTQIWPIEGDDRPISKEMICKGKQYSCDCTAPGSVECIRFHVNIERLHLKSDLGPAFFSLGLAEMGEEVSKSWTQLEQMKFDELLRQNRLAEDG